jgi:hypothetical protein
MNLSPGRFFVGGKATKEEDLRESAGQIIS